MVRRLCRSRMRSRGIKMRKLLTIIFILLFASSAFAAHPGPSQWSLAGVASWAQILTASGTAIPTATITFTIGDFYAQNTAGSSTVTLYRLCASGTTSLWHPFGGVSSGEAGATTLAALTDLPEMTGHDYEYLQHTTGSAFAWGDPAAAITATVDAHVASYTDPHGRVMSIGGNNFTEYGGYDRIMSYNAASSLVYGQVVVASYTEDFWESYPILAPASSTQAIGIFSSHFTDDIREERAIVTQQGEMEVIIATDSAEIAVGDWVVMSDITPGYAERASVVGDQPLPFDEAQRALGICVIPPYLPSGYASSYTQIILKGLR